MFSEVLIMINHLSAFCLSWDVSSFTSHFRLIWRDIFWWTVTILTFQKPETLLFLQLFMSQKLFHRVFFLTAACSLILNCAQRKNFSLIRYLEERTISVSLLLLLLLSHFSHVRLCATPSLGFSRQEHWCGLPFPSPIHKSEKWKWSHSVMSDSSRPHGLQPTRLLHPWDFPGESTGVGCHCLLRSVSLGCIK